MKDYELKQWVIENEGLSFRIQQLDALKALASRIYMRLGPNHCSQNGRHQFLGTRVLGEPHYRDLQPGEGPFTWVIGGYIGIHGD